MPEMDPAIAQALDTMAAEDPAAANLAGTALGIVTAGGGAGRITQERVQRFLWYDLPIKMRPTDDARAEITAALATALDLLELPCTRRSAAPTPPRRFTRRTRRTRRWD